MEGPIRAVMTDCYSLFSTRDNSARFLSRFIQTGNINKHVNYICFLFKRWNNRRSRPSRSFVDAPFLSWSSSVFVSVCWRVTAKQNGICLKLPTFKWVRFENRLSPICATNHSQFSKWVSLSNARCSLIIIIIVGQGSSNYLKSKFYLLILLNKLMKLKYFQVQQNNDLNTQPVGIR